MVKIAWSSIYAHPLPEGHRFPMLKYELIPAQLLLEGSIAENQLFEPGLLPKEIALLTHDPTYVDQFLKAAIEPAMVRKIGFPLSAQLVERERIITQGTIDCALHAIQNGIAFNVAGGTHHAFRNAGEGFCLLNDIAVASNFLLNANIRTKILVIDLDVHQGNGTAAIFEKDDRVFTFSMHGQKNYPLIKQKSNLDIGMPDGFEDEAYLKILANHLPRLFDEVEPDMVFYQSGVDILETDRLGRLKISRKGCQTRDEMVFSHCRRNGVPVVAVMGGGYSPDIRQILDAHCNTFRSALSIFS